MCSSQYGFQVSKISIFPQLAPSHAFPLVESVRLLEMLVVAHVIFLMRSGRSCLVGDREVLISCVLYFFGIMATVLLAGSGSFQGDDDVSLLVQDKFGDVPKAMVTLFQVMTLDSWTSIMRPLMDREVWIPVFFMLFISIAVFLLMNLITAVIVENAFKTAQEDEVQLAMLHDQEKEHEFDTLMQFFTALDVDGDNVITPQELEQAKKDAIPTQRSYH
eukprot:1324827-Amphidinium_carterae.1